MFTRMRRTAALAALAGCTAALAVGGCQVDTGQLQHQAHTYAVSSPVHTLVINDWVGDVHVTGGAGQVSVTERISYRHQLPATTHAVRAGTLTLTGTCPVHQPCDVEYHVRIPPATMVRIDDQVGNIRLTALTGQVVVHTRAGGMALRSLSGAVQVSDRAGSISGSGMSSATAALSTTSAASTSPSPPRGPPWPLPRALGLYPSGCPGGWRMPSTRAPPSAASTSRCRRPAARPTASPPAHRPARSPSSQGDGSMPWSADVGRWGIPLDQLMGSHGLAGAEMALEHVDHVRPRPCRHHRHELPLRLHRCLLLPRLHR